MLGLRDEAITEAVATIDGTMTVQLGPGRQLAAGLATRDPSWWLAADRYELVARRTGGLEVRSTGT